jgi:hypothetical protein
MSSSTAAELSAAAEAIDGYRRRVGGLASAHGGEGHEDLLSAIYEAERSLAVAERTIRRALKLAATSSP